MLHKIIHITNVGKFHDYRCGNQVDFRRLTLIYAPNGRGKSTACAILRSLISDKPELVIERATLDPTARRVPSIKILIEGGECVFENGTWRGSPPPMLIFDSSFIHANVFTGDHVTTHHRRSLLDVILGQQGVQLAQRVRECDQQLRTKDGEIQEAERAVEAARSTVALEDFLQMQPDDGIGVQIAEVERRIETLGRADELRAAPSLSVLPLPGRIPSLRRLLRSTLTDMAEDAEQMVLDHIAKHHMAPGFPWISSGLEWIHDTGECPFCGQSLSGVELIRAYRDCLSDAYRALKAAVARVADNVRGRRRGSGLAEQQRMTAENAGRAQYWQTAGLTVTLPAADPMDGAAEVVGAYLDAVEALIDTKLGVLFESINPSGGYRDSVIALRALRVRWQAYNQAVVSANAQIAELKAGLDVAALAAAQARLGRLKAHRERFTEATASACDRILQLRAERTVIVEARDAAKVALTSYNETVMPAYAQSVNEKLKRFGVDFRITNLQRTDRGRSPNAMYQIEINRVPVDLGDPEEAGGTPSFRCTLSSGERFSLAFALFLAQTDHHPARADITVVVDDPFSSMDAFRLEQSAAQIRRIAAGVKQMIVLSHSTDFLARVHDGFREPGVELRLLQIERGHGGGSRIAPWDIEEALKSTFEKHLAKLTDFVHDGEGQELDVILHVRQVLEFDLRRRQGLALAGAAWLGDMIEAIRMAVPESALRELQSHAGVLSEVNDYVKRYYHGPSKSAIANHPPIDDTELRTHIQLALDFVQPPHVESVPATATTAIRRAGA